MFSQFEKEAFNAGYRLTPDGCRLITPTGEILASYTGKWGHLSCRFGPKSARKALSLHRFQAWLKYGDVIYQKGIVCRHLDGNSGNNTVENLVLGTPQDNSMDRTPKDRKQSAFSASRHVLKHDHVAIVAYYKLHGFRSTMSKFGITSKGSLSYIINKTQTATPVLMHERPKKVSKPAPT